MKSVRFLFFPLILLITNLKIAGDSPAMDAGYPLYFRAFGGASICRPLFDFIKKILPEGSTLLEFGSGWSSGELSKYYNVYSVEHDKRWLNKYNTHYIHAPIVNKWYDVAILKNKLPITYDLILVDGPPGYNASQPGRYGFMRNIGLFNTNVPILIDDVNRAGELKLLKDLSAYLNRPYQVIKCSGKAFGYISGVALI